MGKEIYLHIKEPCHENWEAMSPDQQGRYCQSCAKRVIDFSQMSDHQILDVLKKASGNTCGRFTGGQLERPMVEEKREIPFFLKPYKIALASMVPLFIVSGEASGQDKILKGKVAVHRVVAPIPKLMGDTVMTVCDTSETLTPAKIKPAKVTVKGRVVNKLDEPLPYATVTTNNANNKITIDSSGQFSLTAEKSQLETAISATHAGYQKATAKIDLQKDGLGEVKLVLEQQPDLDTAVIISYPTLCLTGKLGGLSIVQTVTPRDTLKTWVQKFFRNELFTVFPNPIAKGQTLHLRFKQEGDYSLQLFDNSGRLYLEKQIRLAGKGQDFLQAMPAGVGSGVYYLKAINTTSKKQYIEKILVP